jgi:hypothetical protein
MAINDHHPILKAGICQPMWDYYAHTQGGEVVLKSNGVHAGGNMPLLFGNAIMKGKAS